MACTVLTPETIPDQKQVVGADGKVYNTIGSAPRTLCNGNG